VSTSARRPTHRRRRPRACAGVAAIRSRQRSAVERVGRGPYQRAIPAGRAGGPDGGSGAEAQLKWAFVFQMRRRRAGAADGCGWTRVRRSQSGTVYRATVTRAAVWTSITEARRVHARRVMRSAPRRQSDVHRVLRARAHAAGLGRRGLAWSPPARLAITSANTVPLWLPTNTRPHATVGSARARRRIGKPNAHLSLSLRHLIRRQARLRGRLESRVG